MRDLKKSQFCSTSNIEFPTNVIVHHWANYIKSKPYILLLNRVLTTKLIMVSHEYSYKFIEIETKCFKHNDAKLKKSIGKHI